LLTKRNKKLDMEKNIKQVDVSELKFDQFNANLGTNDGGIVLKKSIETLGFGRSVLVDKNNNLIAGNKTTQQAISQGALKALVIESDGTELIVVKRTDLDINESKGRAMALADNKISEINLNWNPDTLSIHFDAAMDIQIPEIIFQVPDFSDNIEPQQKDYSDNIEKMYKLEITFSDEAEQEAGYVSLTEAGYNCKILTL